MAPWHYAMLSILPLMGSVQRARTWAALMFASAIAWLVGPALPAHYLFIDIIAGAAVIARPVTCAQRAIGMIFAMMAIFDIGYMLSPQVDHGELFTDALSSMGWIQFIILTTWGTYDTGKIMFSVPRRHGHQMAHR